MKEVKYEGPKKGKSELWFMTTCNDLWLRTSKGEIWVGWEQDNDDEIYDYIWKVEPDTSKWTNSNTDVFLGYIEE